MLCLFYLYIFLHGLAREIPFTMQIYSKEDNKRSQVQLIRIQTHTHTHTFIYIYIYACIYIHICMHISMHISMHGKVFKRNAFAY